MLKLCNEIQNDPSEQYRQYFQVLSQKVNWYKETYEHFSGILKSGVDSLEKDKATYDILAKQELFNLVEPLFRLLLSRFSYGPSKAFFAENGWDISVTEKVSWMDCRIGFYDLAEILARVLKKNQVTYSFDLALLASSRDERNKIHSGKPVDCINLIRRYQSIRELLVLLDPDNETLPRFEEDSSFDYDRFISEPSRFTFRETATVLIVDSVHDISAGYRRVVANLPWDMVIDFDGYSDFGGLLSSVSHNSLRKEWLLSDKAFSLSHLDRLQTAWCRCSEFLLPYNSHSTMHDTTGAHCFSEKIKNTYFSRYVSNALKKALKPVIALQRFVNIVVLSEDDRIVRGLVDALRDAEFEDYYLSWVGQSEYSMEEYFDGDEGRKYRQEHFYHYKCPIASFFEQFYNYRENWEPRCSIQIEYALAAGSGNFISLNENIRNNLSSYFEVLYREWDSVEHPDNALADPFQKGGQATWKDIATGEALPLDEKKTQNLISKIKTNTGRAQEDCPQKNLFFVVHKPGIGGTTFTKQVAWKLHNDMTVLKVKRYDDAKVFQELQNLYDNVVAKNPILLLAEDTLPNLEAMCDTFLMMMKSRRCALLIACRQGSGFYEKYKNAIQTKLLQLETETIGTFKTRFREISPLSISELNEKARNFEDNIESENRTPFIIGLYFLEKDFHIDSYVQKVLNSSLLPMQKEMIALLALCDVYDSKYLPAAFVNRRLGYRPQQRQTLISVCSAAESLICHSIENDIEVYSFKHKLLSELYLKLYLESPDGCANRYELVKKLIDHAAGSLGTPEQEYVLETLLNILIRNKDRDINDLSQLLVDIALIGTQRSLIEHLAKRFKPEADRLLEKESFDVPEQRDRRTIGILRLVSHAYAHLGKLYAKPPENYQEAAQCFTLATHYMPNNDPFIFHMHGNVLYHHLQKQWADILKNGNFCGEKDQGDFESRMDEALLLFEKACEYGDVQYGLTGQMNLLFEYLRFAYRVNNIRTKEDLRKLTPRQISYQTRLIETLETAEQYGEFDEEAVRNIQNKKNQLYSEILMGDYGKTIEYYQNEYDKLSSSNNTAGAIAALQGLVSAKIQKARAAYEAAKSKNRSLYQMIPEPQTLLNQIGVLLQELYNKRGYYFYAKRTSLFRHWFQLAKLADCAVSDADIQADYWVQTENTIKGKKNPEPYYYKALVLYLERLDGMECEGELQSVRDTIDSMDANQLFDPRRGRLDKIRDLLVEGHGMGRLLNVSDCGPSAEIANRVSAAQKMPTVLCGTVESVQLWGAELSMYAPPALARQKASSEIGKMSRNTLSGNQINHKVMFFGGFTTKGIRAVSDSVKDQDTGEAFSVPEILGAMGNNKDQIAAKEQEQQSGQTKAAYQEYPAVPVSFPAIYEGYGSTGEAGEHKVFYPQYVVPNHQGQDDPQYLNGKVDGGAGGMSVSYFMELFGKKQIEAYGGIHNILNDLVKAGRMDMAVKKVQEHDGEKFYILGLYDESIELSQLLQLQKKTRAAKQKPEAREKTTALPSFKNRLVFFIPEDSELSNTNGTFEVDGVDYPGILVNVKTQNDRKKAKKYNGKIPAVVSGVPQSGKYTLKMK